MGAGEASTDEKTSKNSAKQCKTVILAPKRPLQLSKFKFFNSKLNVKPLLALLPQMSHIWSICGVWAPRRPPHRREDVEKQWKTVKNSDFGAKIKIQNFEFKIWISGFLHYWSQILQYMKRLRSMGAGEASTDEKTAKNGEKWRKTAKHSETAIFGAKNSR